MTAPVNSVNELIHVVGAIDAHCKRVRLKSGAWLRAELKVVDLDREELGALQAHPTADAFTEVRRDRKTGTRSVDVVHIEFDRLRLIARSADRDATDAERAAVAVPGATQAHIPIRRAMTDAELKRAQESPAAIQGRLETVALLRSRGHRLSADGVALEAKQMARRLLELLGG